MSEPRTTLESLQLKRGEPLYMLAARLGLSATIVYKMAGRSYRQRQQSLVFPALRIVSKDTGIPVQTLFDEAMAAWQASSNE